MVPDAVQGVTWRRRTARRTAGKARWIHPVAGANDEPGMRVSDGVFLVCHDGDLSLFFRGRGRGRGNVVLFPLRQVREWCCALAAPGQHAAVPQVTRISNAFRPQHSLHVWW